MLYLGYIFDGHCVNSSLPVAVVKDGIFSKHKMFVIGTQQISSRLGQV